jgi:hypothetical protein
VVGHPHSLTLHLNKILTALNLGLQTKTLLQAFSAKFTIKAILGSPSLQPTGYTGGPCSGYSLECAPGTIEEVGATGAWLVETAGVDRPSPTTDDSDHSLVDLSELG